MLQDREWRERRKRRGGINQPMSEVEPTTDLRVAPQRKSNRHNYPCGDRHVVKRQRGVVGLLL